MKQDSSKINNLLNGIEEIVEWMDDFVLPYSLEVASSLTAQCAGLRH